LRKNLEVMQRFAVIDGSVKSELPEGAMTVVVLIKSDTGRAVDSFALMRARKYFFVAPAGTYSVAAFVYLDRDFRFDPARGRGVWYGAPDIIRLADGQHVEGIDLSLDAPHGTPLDRPITAPELGRRGMYELPDVNLGTVTTTDAPRFSAENGKLGMWQPVDFVLRVGAGIYFLEPYDPDKTPVLFVHGIGGHPGEFAYLIKRLDRTRFQPWLLYYPSGGRVELLGRVLIRWLNALGARYPVQHAAIVAHSMGGLVVRSAINQAMESAGKRRAALDAFVTISTPWGGHRAAELGVEYAPAVVPAWRDMQPGSPFLEGILRTTLPPECRYYLLFSYGGGSSLIRGTNDGVVTLVSELAPAAQEQAVKVYGLPEGHVSILRSDNTARTLNQILAAIPR
jgi:pimeloyl-ACP methyl ester carboxylesterase